MPAGVRDLAKPVSEARWWRNIAIYGPPKVGKTVLSCEGPDTLLLDCDPGMGSISLKNHPALAEKVQIVGCRDEGSKKIMEIGWKLKRDPEGFKTVVLDTMSELLQFELQKIRKAEKGKPGREEFKSTQPDYGVVNNMLKEIIYFYVDLPLNVIFVCHQTEKEDIETPGRIITRPALSPEVSQILAGSVDITCYLESVPDIQDKEVRTLRVRPARTTQAGTRIFFPASTFKNPNLSDIFKTYELTKETTSAHQS